MGQAQEDGKIVLKGVVQEMYINNQNVYKL